MILKQFAIAIDQLINTLVWFHDDGFGYADETISARAYRLSVSGHKGADRARKLIDLIFFWQKDHCYQSYISERDRKQLPAWYGNERI